MTKKLRVPVSESQQPLYASPFAHLDPGALPSVPVAPSDSPHPIPEQKKMPRVVLRREKAHRGGKTVIVVSQLPTHLSVPELERLTAEAKRACGCGGTLRGREIELQGNQPARVRAHFESIGYVVGGV